jgi:hypothetical protein
MCSICLVLEKFTFQVLRCVICSQNKSNNSNALRLDSNIPFIGLQFVVLNWLRSFSCRCLSRGHTILWRNERTNKTCVYIQFQFLNSPNGISSSFRVSAWFWSKPSPLQLLCNCLWKGTFYRWIISLQDDYHHQNITEECENSSMPQTEHILP